MTSWAGAGVAGENVGVLVQVCFGGDVLFRQLVGELIMTLFATGFARTLMVIVCANGRRPCQFRFRRRVRAEPVIAAIAESLHQNGYPFERSPASSKFRLFDGVSLDVVNREPAQLERALFRYRTAEPALRFLDEATTPQPERRLFAGMPSATCLTAAQHRLVSS